MDRDMRFCEKYIFNIRGSKVCILCVKKHEITELSEKDKEWFSAFRFVYDDEDKSMRDLNGLSGRMDCRVS